MAMSVVASRHWAADVWRGAWRRVSVLRVHMRARLTVLALLIVIAVHKLFKRLRLRRVEQKAVPDADVLSVVPPSAPAGPPDDVLAIQRRPKSNVTLTLSDSYQSGWANSQRRACQWFAAGCCTFGDDCFYSHMTEGANVAFVPGWRRRWKKDLCSFHTLGVGCSWGEKCRNAHGVEELDNLGPPAPPASFPPSGLRYFDSHCHLDGMLHVRRFGYFWLYKTRPCIDYVKPGRKCTWDTKCNFAHGDHEIRKRPQIERHHLEEFIDLFPRGFDGMVHNCCDQNTIEPTIQLVEWGRQVLDGKIYASFGCHPTDFACYTDELEAQLLDGIARCGDKAVAWGECGMDFYRKPSMEDRREMCEVFIRQIHVAVEHGLPIIIHSRCAEVETLDILREHLPRDVRMHLHSFEGSAELLQCFLEEWPYCYLGVNGVITYPTGGYIAKLVRAAPLDRILLETDGPFMTPEPYRFSGLGSHPGHIPWIAERVAAVKDVSMEAVLAATHQNHCAMYDVSDGSA